MSMTIERTVRPEFVHAKTGGEFDLEEAKRTFLETLDLVEQNQSGKVLLDCRAIIGEPEVIERFYYGEFVANAVRSMIEDGVVGRVPQFAYIMQEPVLDPLRLGETVAVNRGMNVKAFENEGDALTWLGIE